MATKIVSGILLALLLISTFTLTFDVQMVKADSSTITVPDDHPTIQEAINAASPGDTVYVKAGTYYEHVVVDENDLTLTGEDRSTAIIDGGGTGMVISVTANNVEISNFTIRNAYMGIDLSYSHSNSVVKNNISNNKYGVFLSHTSILWPGNNISFNTITQNSYVGIGLLSWVYKTTIVGNLIEGNYDGIISIWSKYNNISRNTISESSHDGIHFDSSSDSFVFHNNFIDNSQQAYSYISTNTWDDGYPSGGNYWSDHVTVDDHSGVNQDELGSDGIVDEPYIIDDYNRDHYPLAQPWSPTISATVDIDPDTLNLKSQGRWITACIELPEAYSVDDVDVSSLMLNDAVPAEPEPTAIGDLDSDGVPDLMVKLNRAAVESFILDHISLREAVRVGFTTVTLTIAGELTDGTPFQGSDTIKIICTVPQKL